MLKRSYTQIVPHALVEPYKMRGETVSHATIIVLASNRDEANERTRKDYQTGVELNFYKPLED